MSRIGRLPVALPDNVEIVQEGRTLRVKGPLGELSREIHPEMTRRARRTASCGSFAPATSRSIVPSTA